MRVRPKHVAAVVLSVLLASPSARLCEGWAPTAAARMACCAEGASCAMHESAPASVTQAGADGCCAVSEQDQSPSTCVPVAPPPLLVSPVPAMLAPTVVAFDYSPDPIPLPRSRVPRHLLLSVFLV